MQGFFIKKYVIPKILQRSKEFLESVSTWQAAINRQILTESSERSSSGGRFKIYKKYYFKFYEKALYIYDTSKCKYFTVMPQPSRELLLEIIKNAFIGLFEFNPESGVLSVDDTYASSLGYSKEELSSLEVWQTLLHPNHKNRVQAELESFLEGPKPSTTSMYALRHKDGSFIWHKSTIYKNEDGSITGCHIDITNERDALQESEKAKEELRKNADRLDESQHLAGMGDFTWLIDTGEVSWSRGMHELLGYDKSETIDYAKVNTDIHHPDNLERITMWLHGCIESGKSHHTPNEYRLIRKDGKILTVQTSISIQYKDDKPHEVIGACFDITERKQTEAELIKAKYLAEKNENRFRTLFSSVETGIVVHAPDTSIITCNAQSMNLLGLTEDQMQGKVAIDPYWKFIYENGESIPIDDYPVMRVIKSKTPQRNQILGVIRPDKEVIWLLVNGFPALNEQGDLAEITISFIDISERKLAENALLEAKERAEESESRLMIATKSAQLGVWDYNIVDYKVIWGDRSYELYGIKKGTTITMDTWLNSLHPDDKERTLEAVNNTLNENKGNYPAAQ